MKPILKICCLVCVVILFSAIRNKASAQEPSVSYQTFYDDLSPYGQWIDNPQYGYVWHPSISDFRPYSTGGHWIFTDQYGWMWASDYDWGWAPFHYGRWLYDDFYGWVWIPGYEWSPAWVEWRTGGDYYGWAPLGPGVNISLSFGQYSPPYNYWCFVPRNYILSPRVYDYCAPQSRNTVIINNTTIVNNYYRRNNVFVTGPKRSDVERYTGRVNPFVVRELSGPGRTQFTRNAVNVYRPTVERNESNRFTPRNVERYNRQNGNPFQQRNQDVVNSRGERPQANQNDNAFQRRQEEIIRQNEAQRQIQQRQILQQQQQNRNDLERRQSEMRQQQQQHQQDESAEK